MVNGTFFQWLLYIAEAEWRFFFALLLLVPISVLIAQRVEGGHKNLVMLLWFWILALFFAFTLFFLTYLLA